MSGTVVCHMLYTVHVISNTILRCMSLDVLGCHSRVLRVCAISLLFHVSKEAVLEA